jgi:isoquinoline 1-oxidoreductase beta subunit
MNPGFSPKRAKAVTEKGRGDSNFRAPPLEGRAKGFGFYYSHLGYFAEVVEASLEKRQGRGARTCGSLATSAATSSTRSGR